VLEPWVEEPFAVVFVVVEELTLVVVSPCTSVVEETTVVESTGVVDSSTEGFKVVLLSVIVEEPVVADFDVVLMIDGVVLSLELDVVISEVVVSPFPLVVEEPLVVVFAVVE
jgi:hypothetical protein